MSGLGGNAQRMKSTPHSESCGALHTILLDLLASCEVFKLSYQGCQGLTSTLSAELSSSWPTLLLIHRLYHLSCDGFHFLPTSRRTNKPFHRGGHRAAECSAALRAKKCAP